MGGPQLCTPAHQPAPSSPAKSTHEKPVKYHNTEELTVETYTLLPRAVLVDGTLLVRSQEALDKLVKQYGPGVRVEELPEFVREILDPMEQ